jgi:hypothetical protein
MCAHKNPKILHKHKINHHLPYKHLHQVKMRKMAQEEEDQDRDDEPPQEEDIDQGGDEVDQEKEDEQ